METDPILSHPMLVAALAENATLRADNAALRVEMGKLREAMEKLQVVLEAVQTQISKNSHNSHKPPSSDGPSATPRPPSKPTGRKRGGQPGRKGKFREALPEGSETRTVDVKLTTCPHCACEIPPEAITGSQTDRVLDLVQQLTEVTAYRREEGCCPHCHRKVQAPIPPEAGGGELGPRLRVMAGYLRTEGRMSIGVLHYFFNEVLQVKVSRGWLYEACVGLGQALAPTYEYLQREIRHSLVVNMDETGFGRKDRNWIWTALTARTALFHFATSRGQEALLEILPEDFPGVLGTDRYAAYHKLQRATRQYCWAHLRRDIIALSESKDTEVEAIAKRMLADQEEIFTWWHVFRDGEIDRKCLRAGTAVILARFKRNFQALAKTKDKKARTFGSTLIENWSRLWTFLRVDGLDPTNNRAERALRPLVIMKRIFQRLPSNRGREFFERVYSAGATARIRSVQLFEWLIRALNAYRLGEPAPALEPGG
jgi:transposase